MQAPNRLYQSEVRGSDSRVKPPCEQGRPHCTYVLQAEQRLPHATEEKAKRSFPMERGPTAKHHPAWNPHCAQWFRAEEFPLLCPKPKVMPRFRLGDVGKARWPPSHRWTDTSPILQDAAHDSRNQRPRGVALCVEPPLGVRPTLPAARGSSQRAASAESLVADAERSNRRVTCPLHIISDVTRVRDAQGTTSPSSVRSLLVLLLYTQQCLSCLARPVWGPTGRCRGVLPRTNARCVVGQ